MRAPRGQLVVGAAAAALLLAIVALAASSSGVKGVPEVPTPSPTPAAERELFGGSLQPGLRYHTRAFIPQLSFVASDTEWMVDDATRSNILVIARRNRTGKPGGEFPPRSFVTFRRTHPGGPTLHQRFQRRRGLVVSPYEPVLIGGRTAESFTVTYPSGSRRREIVLGDGLVIGLLGASRRDLEKLEAPAAELLRTLRVGRLTTR
jgi:hypothetical protein